jgi:putative hydrolase of the HAD superfamily
MPIRAVLFDATGTLIELAEAVGDTYSRIAAAHGAPLSARRLGDAFRHVLGHAPERVFPGLDPSAVAAAEHEWWKEVVRQTVRAADPAIRAQPFADFDAFFGDLFDTYSKSACWRTIAGAPGALADLRAAGYRTGVVSNFDQRLPIVLQGLNIAPLLDIVMYPLLCGAAKPNPAIFHAALESFGIAASSCVYVGHDPARDIAAACEAGLIPLALDAGTPLHDLPARIATIANLKR